ncbi:hypothetical protein L1281_001674 [Neisseria sp. HSC-16F19]|nr:hypothetical protein [Neisseria sp. HSC-16F19]MCP2041080.1 hypothetical protein [Neisseria sp. HSC-16F19]
MNTFFKLIAAAAAVLLLVAAVSLLRPFADYSAWENQSLAGLRSHTDAQGITLFCHDGDDFCTAYIDSADPLATETAVFKFADKGKSRLQRVVQCRSLGFGERALITRCQRNEGGRSETLWQKI